MNRVLNSFPDGLQRPNLNVIVYTLVIAAGQDFDMQPERHPTRHRSARYVLGAGRTVAGLVGGLESSVATELTTAHPSPPPPP